MKTRAEMAAEFEVNQFGLIKTPGKFEGEPLYTPYFWNAHLNGLADTYDGEFVTFRINREDLREFPELEGYDAIWLWETSDGFVISCLDDGKVEDCATCEFTDCVMHVVSQPADAAGKPAMTWFDWLGYAALAFLVLTVIWIYRC